MIRYKNYNGILIAIVAIFLLISPIYSQDEMGVIHGKLIDKQLNNPITNQPVTLSIHKGEDITQQDTTTDEEGIYRFEGLSIDATTHYSITTTYNEIEQTEKDIMLSTFVPTVTVDMNIGGKSDDSSKVHIKSYTLVIGPPPEGHPPDGAISIIEAFDVENLNELHFQMEHGNKEVGFFTPLPRDFEAFHPHAPADLVLDPNNNNIILPKSIPPGPTQVGFTYVTHVHNNKVDLSRRVPFQTDQITLLVMDGINLVPLSKDFLRTKSEPIHNRVYNAYRTKPNTKFLEGNKVDLRLGIPKEGIGQFVFIAIASALTGGFLVAAIFMLRYSRRPSSKSVDSESLQHEVGWLRKLNNDDIEHARTARLEFITILDELHEKDIISERIYNRFRKEQTDRLTEILDQRTERGLE
ncbi:Ig-like domain-containing protein [Candidatus Poribacteria bacterium]|nr:Ig-like domain-containing protein [Candidatus Poribacteria bacterium]